MRSERLLPHTLPIYNRSPHGLLLKTTSLKAASDTLTTHISSGSNIAVALPYSQINSWTGSDTGPRQLCYTSAILFPQRCCLASLTEQFVLTDSGIRPFSNMGPLQLDALPTEVKQRIITIGSCENALKIRHVSKSWKEITSDPLMYKAMIESNTDGWSTIPLALDAPWSSWARYALADARASDLATWIDDNEKTRNLDSQPPASLTLPKGVNKMIYDWVPQLVTSQRKSSLSNSKFRRLTQT